MDNSIRRQSEIEINLKEVTWDLLTQWKAILIVALLMAVLIAGAKYYKDTNSYKAAMLEKGEVAQSGLTTEERIADVLGKLPDDEVATVEYIINQNEWIETEKDYINNSILMNSNPSDQRTLILDYYISMDDPSAEKMTALVYGYTGYLGDESLINSVGNAIDKNVESKYIAELISVNSDNSGVQPGNYNLTTESGADGATMEIRVVLPADADATAVKEALTSALRRYTSELNNIIGSHNIGLINSTEAYLFNSVAVNNRNSIMYSISNLQNNEKNMKSNLSDDQNSAIDAITAIKKEQTADLNISQEESNKKTLQASMELSKPGVSKKYALLGFIMGIMVYACAYLVLLIIKGRVNYTSDAECYTQSRLIGEIYKRINCKGLQKLLQSNFVNKYRYKGKTDPALQIEKASDKLEAICIHEGIADTLLLDMTGEGNSSLIKELGDKVSEKGVSLRTMKVAEDIEEKNLLSSKYVVFALSSDTKASKVIDVVNLCNGYDINSLGSIFIGAY